MRSDDVCIAVHNIFQGRYCIFVGRLQVAAIAMLDCMQGAYVSIPEERTSTYFTSVLHSQYSYFKYNRSPLLEDERHGDERIGPGLGVLALGETIVDCLDHVPPVHKGQAREGDAEPISVKKKTEKKAAAADGWFAAPNAELT